MSRAIAFLAAFLSAAAQAAVTPLAGSTPQSAVAGAEFAPVRVLVTDAQGIPVAGAAVQWRAPDPTALPSDNPCTPGLGFPCWTVTDARGIAALDALRPAIAGEYAVDVTTYQPADGDYGSTRLEFSVAPRAPARLLLRVSGDHQSAAIGTPYAEPFVVQTLTPEGRPLPFADVTFRVVLGGTPSGRFISGGLPQFLARTASDANGIATAPRFVAGYGIGDGVVYAEIFDENALAYVRAPYPITNTTPEGATSASFQDMWWSGPLENGWGMSLAQHGDRLFGVVFAYDARGEPTWWVLPAGRWDEGLGSLWIANLYSPRGAPYYAYDAKSFVPGIASGSTTLSFRGPAEGSLHAFVGATVDKAIVRQDFSTGALAPLQGVADMWWGGASQNGWGVAILEQPGGLFAVWFTYDASGQPTWFVMPSGDWADATTYAGAMYRTRGSPWAGAPYDPTRFAIASTGTFRLRFADRDHASLDYAIDGHSGALALVRQGF